MDKESITAIQKNVDEIGGFFSFFKDKKLKEDIFSYLEDIEKNLEVIPRLTKDLKSIKKKYEFLDA